jgi:hypothetical protein
MGIPTPTRNSIFCLALAATMLVLAAVSLACPHARARRYRCRGLARARAGRRIRCVARTSWRLPSPWAHTLTLGRRMVDRRSCSLVGARESRTSVVLCCCPSPLLDPFLLLPLPRASSYGLVLVAVVKEELRGMDWVWINTGRVRMDNSGMDLDMDIGRFVHTLPNGRHRFRPSTF